MVTFADCAQAEEASRSTVIAPWIFTFLKHGFIYGSFEMSVRTGPKTLRIGDFAREAPILLPPCMHVKMEIPHRMEKMGERAWGVRQFDAERLLCVED